MYIMDIWRSQERSFFWVFFNLFFVYNFKTQRCDDTSVFAVRFAGFSDKSFASRFRGLNPLVPVLVWWNVEGGVKIVDFSDEKKTIFSPPIHNIHPCITQPATGSWTIYIHILEPWLGFEPETCSPRHDTHPHELKINSTFCNKT